MTDPDSQLIKATRGFIQGYNAQAAANEHEIVIAAEVTVDAPDFGHRQPRWNGGFYAFMRRVLSTELGGELYRKRRVMIEPVFGDTQFNRRTDLFQQREQHFRERR